MRGGETMIRMHLEREESEQKVLCSPTSNLSLLGRSSGFDIPRYRLLSTLDSGEEASASRLVQIIRARKNLDLEIYRLRGIRKFLQIYSCIFLLFVLSRITRESAVVNKDLGMGFGGNMMVVK